jgi:hypothetical protein
MPIPFTSSPAHTLGVEIEMGLVHDETDELECAAPAVLSEAGSGYPGGAHPRIHQELFQSMWADIGAEASIVSQAQSQTIEQVERDCDRNKWLDANEAVAYGCIDKILYRMPEPATGKEKK